jgi:WD40 repeat protein
MSAAASPFYVTGGTLRHDAPSYVVRRADDELYEGLSRGEFCYILTPRQMGKSSLMARTVARLRQEGAAAVAVDLTAIGQNLTPEQWYDGLLLQIGESLQIEEELDDFWQNHPRLGPMQRWMHALREVVLARVPGRIVIFIDEIDAVRSLPFSTDEFFAGIRECYNRRNEDPEFARLTFCLLGVASPSDLIRDTRITPFNIGRRIELTDFTEAEAAPLAAGLLTSPPAPPRSGEGSCSSPLDAAPPPRSGEGVGGRGKPLLRRILYWTGGHPYLTQRLCQAVSAGGNAADGARGGSVASGADVDRLCEELFLSPRARERDDNLLFVRESLLRSEGDLATLLDLYGQVCRGKAVRDDPGDPRVTLLRLSGVARPVKGFLRERNRIYARVFDATWVRENMPDAEVRRQRAAFRRGVARTALVAGTVVALLAGLAVVALRQREESRQRLVKLHVAHGMRLVEEGNSPESLHWFAEALRLDAGRPEREAIHRMRFASAFRECPRLTQIFFHDKPVNVARWSPDERRVLTAGQDGAAHVWDVETGKATTPPLKHGTTVRWAMFSPDGRRVVTASKDHTARVWDAETGRPVSPPLRHKGIVFFAAFSPDGRRVVTAGDDRAARIWDTTTWKLVTAPLMHSAHVGGALFSPDGRRVVTSAGGGGGAGGAQVWDAATGKPLTPLLHGGTHLLSALFSPDGQRIVTASHDRTARVWDATTGALIAVMDTPNACTHAIFSPDGRRVVATSADRTVHVFDVASAQALTSPLRHRNIANFGRFSPDGRRVATCSDDTTARVWDAETGEPVTPPLAHSAAVRHVAFSADGRRVLTASDDGTARVWDIAGSAMPQPPILPSRFIWHHLPMSADGRFVITVSSEGVAEVWEIATGRRIGPPLEHRKDVNQAAFSPDGRRVVTASNDRTAQIWEFGTSPESDGSARRGTPPLQHPSEVLGAAFSPGGDRVVTACADGTVRLWDAGTGRPTGVTLKHGKKVRQAVFSPDGRRIATASADKTARIWDAATGRALTPPLKHSYIVWEIRFSPDGRRVLTTTANGTEPQIWLDGSDTTRVRVWDAETGRPITASLPGAYGSFSPDGRRILGTGLAHGTAWVRDARTGRPVIPPLRHDHWVVSAIFSPDGRRVATTSHDYTARIWDAETGEPVTPPLRQDFRVEYAVFTPDGKRLITASGQDRVYTWDLPREARPVADLQMLAQLLTGRRVDAAGGAAPLRSGELREAWERLRPRHPGLFTVSSGEVSAWEWWEMEDAARAGRWPAVRMHADRLIGMNPTKSLGRRERAWGEARSGRYLRAVDDYAATIALGTDPPRVWWLKAVAHLAAEDLAGYRKTCAGMLERFRRNDHPSIMNDVAFACSVAPNAVPDLRRPVRLAERAVAGTRDAWARQCLGAALYRAGEFRSAVQRLHESMALGRSGGAFNDWVFLAMAYARLGHPAEAGRWLEKAEQEMARTVAAQRGGASSRSEDWSERTIQTRLLREARQVVGRR